MKMKKKTLWKDIRKSITHSWGRFFSIMLLMALGSFALVGLFVTGPDMRKTGTNYFEELNVADITILSDFGIDESEIEYIEKASGIQEIEYLYLKDVVKENTNISFRIFSKTENISLYEIIDGEMPVNDDEIALDDEYNGEYKIGDTITFTENTDEDESDTLKIHTFKIVGFIRSGEILTNVNRGQTTVGTGELDSFAVVNSTVFDSEVYMMAKITFEDTDGVDPYSDEYKDLIQSHKEELSTLLEEQQGIRFESIKSEYQKQIDEGNEELNNAKQELEDARISLEEANEQIENAKKQIEENETKLSNAKKEINQAQNEINENEEYLNQKKSEYNSGIAELSEKKQELENAQKEIETAQAQDELNSKITEAENAQNQINEAEQELASAKTELENAEQQLETAKKELLSAKKEYSSGVSELEDAKEELTDKENEYNEKLLEFQEEEPSALEEIAKNEEKLSDAQKTLDDLSSPTYSVDTRREIPGSEGYKIYGTIAEIVDSLAKVFPIFLYFVAALVTLTTMTRFVNEERINSGTLKALGYNDNDITKKFTVYGLIAGMIGTIIGIALGHTLLPYIVYNAYKNGFTLPKIELHFNLKITIIAILLSLMSSVIPAYIVSTRELKQKPANLLLPKVPKAGSKIFMERIKFIWNKMSFTHKVTARNIFRYKSRMFMTIFGVAGSVAILFAGFSVQASISEINEKQFQNILKYDIIVALNDNINDNENTELDSLLQSEEISSYESIYYEEVSKVAGKNNDNQSIKLIVTDNYEEFSNYINLNDRKTQEKLSLNDNGAIISERLADLLGVSEGDIFTIKDSEDIEREIIVSDVCEMYAGHFIFMNSNEYEKIYEESYEYNAKLILLNDKSSENTNEQSARFMELSAVKGISQNTTLSSQIETIVTSLDKIMKVLIIVAAMLAIVILYNLTNINVSERIRELSTIKVLGFFDKEVTMYIYRETTTLSAIGIVVGWIIGILLHSYILNVVPPEEVMFDPAIWIGAYIIPLVTVTIISLILKYYVNNKLKNVDMLEALKSVD